MKVCMCLWMSGGRPDLHPLLLLSSLDQSARDYFTIVLRNSPGQRRVAHACAYCA